MFALPFLLTVAIAAGARPATTVLLQFDQAYSQEAVGEMKHEAQAILKGSGLRFDWRLLNDVHPSDSFHDVIIVRFKGHCGMSASPGSLHQGAPLAQTHTANGEILPFTDVLCDTVSASVGSVMTHKDYRRGDYLLGRALGRVLSHEIYHVLARSHDHGREGVTRSALSGTQLVSEHLSMSAGDLRRLSNDPSELEGR